MRSESQFARERLAPESGADIETCRTNLTARIDRCELTCDSCAAECTSKAARELVSAWRCSVGLPIMGTFLAMSVSDQGIDVKNRWGSIRQRGLIGTPDESWVEQYRTLVQNSVDRPRVARNGVSCRKSHVESTTGGFQTALNDDGSYIRRQGFMVGCNTDLDCYSRCGEHPISGNAYVCTHNPEFYSYAGEGRDAYEHLVTEEAAQKAAGKPHRRVWRSSHQDPHFYFVDEPGDDIMDPKDGSMGVCTDVHMDYANSGCLDPVGASVTMTLVGAAMRFNANYKSMFCGILIEHGDSDFFTDVGISEVSLLYPRTLVHAAQVNGVERAAVTCWNPLDCERKCDFFRTHSRDGGLTEPAACTLCDPMVPSNIITWVLDVRDAIQDDIITALRIAAICLNPVACVCQVFMMVKPAWIDSLPNEVLKCRAGDMFGLLVERILIMIIEMAEGIINDHIMSFLRNAIGWLGVKVNDICIPYQDKKLCPSDPKALEAMFGCSTNNPQAHKRCFYERQRAICLGQDDARDRYEELFDSPTATELEQQFKEIVGDTYDSIPPAMLQAFKDAGTTDTGFNRAAATLCDGSLKDSMTLDEIILSCVFNNIETFCPGAKDDDDLDTYLREVQWKLPDVRWDYTASPPPPPPSTFGSFHDLVAADPDGMEELREKISEFWPSLTFVASQTYGNSNPLKHDPFL